MIPVIISAAGLGSRLGMNMPKCLLPLHEGRLIDYQLALLPPGSDVRIVVGFKENEVIEHVGRHWPDVTFVRNPNFATTSNSYSLHLATRWLDGPFIAIDGDLVIDEASFRRFLDHCATAERTTVGVVPRASEEAVGVRFGKSGEIIEFLRPDAPGQQACSHEWCGIAYFRDMRIEPNQKYVFEELARHLPLPAFEIQCSEIDTPSDLERVMQVFARAPMRLPWTQQRGD
jgi:choline kinase